MSDKSSSSSKGGGDNVIMSPQSPETHPQGLLAAIGIIERAYADEIGGAIIDPRRLTSPQKYEFMEIGMRSSFISGLLMALLSPLAIGVFDKYIPIFGSYQPSLFDQLCGVMLALIFPLCYAFLYAGVATNHLGGYSRAMVSNLLGGMTLASFGKAIITFIAFHFIYFKVLSDKNISWAIQKLYVFKISYDTALSMFTWIRDFKHVFITSSYFVLINTMVFVAIPYLAYFWAHQRNKKLIEAGVVNVFQENS